MIEKASAFLEMHYKGQKGHNGSLVTTHYYNVVKILKVYGLYYEDLLAGALLQDVMTDNTVSREQVITRFGERVGFIAQALSRIKEPRFETDEGKDPESHFRTYIHLFYYCVMADQYILFIKLAGQIAYFSSIGTLTDEIVKLEIQKIEKYFFPVYDKIASSGILLPFYSKVYSRMRKRLEELIKGNKMRFKRE